ncbi:cation efflux system protein [Desulfoluna limicola]|uniref:Cation efflux system protein n=1 Tax=Desulfoluna limicola TaxID=2810562 RepID=A0ABN6F5H1_9BACT|nr:TolC family protein [Desulfoluna limicola]BCS97211.1 cation efflux system protein [Desulfoluna limicola]
MRSKFICLLISLVTVLSVAATQMAEAALPVARIGIVTDGQWLRHPEAVDVFKQELLTLAEGEFDVRFPEARTLHGNWSIDGVNGALDALLNAPDVDMIMALGFVATSETFKRKNLQKPVFCPFVVDDKVQKLPINGGGSGVKNLNYINVQKSIDKEIKTLNEIAPFSTLSVIANPFDIKALPGVVAYLKNRAKDNGIQLHFVEYAGTAEKTLEKIPPSTEAILVSALLQTPPDEFDKLVNGLIDKMLPSFSIWGMDDVKAGVLATLTPQSNLQHLARSVAVNILEVLRGEKAETLPVSFSGGQSLTINWATAKAIEVYPKWDIMTEAQLIDDHVRGEGRRLTLEDAVKESVKANLDLMAADRAVASGMEDVKKSRSSLLPQIGLGTQATLIDSDRAAWAAGSNPEKTWTGSATAGQVLYSDKAWTGYTVQKHTQESRVENREALMLDIMNTAATAYLNVLRAEAVLNIQTDNLKLTRANLERSKVRVSVGAAGPEEVYRWESELANRLQEVLVAESSLLDARSEMNRIMGRPLTEDFAPAESGVRDPLPVLKDHRIFDYLETPRKIRVLMDFLMQESLVLSPELKAINAQMAARQRILVSSKREFWLPTIELQGSVTEMFDKSGEGSQDTSFDDTNWSVGVSASLPLFSGGGKSAELRQSREEIARLDTERKATAERVTQRTLIAMNKVRASYPGIRLSKNAAESAANNLQLVTDSYVRGVLSIIDLLDAQNLALVAEQQAANAVYDFLTNLMEVQRSTGAFFLYADEAERDEWFGKMEHYFSK